jgi:uncharacterized protein (DUF3084 family)
LWFRPKDQAARAAAKGELEDTRTGRKARRDELAKAEAMPSKAQMDLMEALNALRDGQPLPGTR